MTLVSEKAIKDRIRNRLKNIMNVKTVPYPAGIGGEGGTPDRVGCKSVTITADMVGKTVGIFIGIEVKRPTIKDAEGRVIQKGGEITDLQCRRIAEWQALGAQVIVTDDPYEAVAFVKSLEHQIINTTKNQNIDTTNNQDTKTTTHQNIDTKKNQNTQEKTNGYNSN